MSKRKALLPNPHPGEILLEEFLKPMDLSQTALARAIDMPPPCINAVSAVAQCRIFNSKPQKRLRTLQELATS